MFLLGDPFRRRSRSRHGALVALLLVAALGVARAEESSCSSSECAPLAEEELALQGAPVLLQVSTQLAVPQLRDAAAAADTAGDSAPPGLPQNAVADSAAESVSPRPWGRPWGRPLALPPTREELHRGRGRAWFLCALAAAGVGVASAALFLWRHGRPGVNKAAVAVDLVCVFQENVLFTFTMLDALDLCRELGKGAEYSGVLIGSHKMGTGLGSLLLWLMLRYSPDIWRRGRSAVAAGVALQFVGAFCFGLAAILSREEERWAPGDIVAPVLCLARLVQGVGGGLQLALTSNHIARLVPSTERVSENMNFFLAACLGLGLGPLFASLVKLLAATLPCKHPGLPLDSVLVVSMVLPVVQLACLLTYPSLGSVEDQHSQPSESTDRHSQAAAAAMPPAFSRTAVIACCVMMQVVRNFSVSSLEAALTMLLETRYHWAGAWVGPAVAIALSSGLWLKLAYDASKQYASSTTWLRLMIAIALMGSVLLLPVSVLDSWTSLNLSALFGGYPELPLLLGSALLFPALALSSGIVMGTLQDYVFPGDHFLNLNTATLLTLVGADLFGRGLGPPAARGAVAAGGQERFAWQQIAAGLAALFIHELLVCFVARRRGPWHKIKWSSAMEVVQLERARRTKEQFAQQLLMHAAVAK